MSSGALMVANAAAGRAEEQAIATARDALARHGSVEVVTTTSPDDLDEVLSGVDGRRLVVCGGDGSIHLVVERLRAAGRLGEVPVGLVPLGTGNDLAHSLRLPLDPAEAAAVAATGTPRRLDLIVADDGPIAVNALHAGIGVDAAERAERLKDRIGEFAYPLGAMAAGAAAVGWDVVVEVDGEQVVPQVDGPVLLVAVLNAPTFGGGTPAAPQAEPDDGALDVVVSTATSATARPAFGLALRSGTHLDRDDVVHATGQTVRIHGQSIGYNLDGELEQDAVDDRTFHVEAAAWELVVPGG